MRANYHTHSSFCDGKNSPAEMAAAAAAAGYRTLGFSSHAPLPWPTSWTLPEADFPAYGAEVRRLAAEWAPRGLEILLGLEIDWLEGIRSPRDALFDRLNLDYRLGSVHYLRLGQPEPFTVDSSPEEFQAALRSAGADGIALYREYYENLAALIRSGGFEILGHFDLVTKNNGGGRWFDEESPHYLDAAYGAAEELRGKDIVVEVNVGGMARGKMRRPYPSLPIARRLRELGVPLTFCADAHAVAHLGAHLEAARELARAAGYRSVAVLSEGRWSEVGIEET